MGCSQPGATGMNGWCIVRTEQRREWMSVLERTVQYDVHHLPEYHRVAEQRGEGVGHLFTYSEGGHVIALPLLLRLVDDAETAGWRDATSVYGYGGPVASAAQMPATVIRNFQAALKEALVERRVVAAFSRLHPLISQHELLAGLGECRRMGETVSIDLTRPLAEQWGGYRKSWALPCICSSSCLATRWPRRVWRRFATASFRIIWVALATGFWIIHRTGWSWIRN